MKVCTRCKSNQNEDHFRMRYDRRSKSKYLNSICKRCESEVSNINYFSRKHDPDFLKQWNKKSRDYYKKNHSLCVAKIKERNSKDEHKEYMRKYRHANRDKIKSQQKKRSRKWQVKIVSGITDQYCIQLIRTQTGIHKDFITAEMIEQKRTAIKLKRKLYEIERQIESPRDNGRINSVFQGINRNGSNRP